MGSSEDCRWRRAEDAVERTCFYPLLRKLPKKKRTVMLGVVEGSNGTDEDFISLFYMFKEAETLDCL